MSSKLTSKKLDLLIEQVLMEKTININLKDKLNDIDKLRADLGFAGNPPQLGSDANAVKGNIEKLVNLDKDPDSTLDNDDFKKAFSDPNSDEYQTAKALKGSTIADIADVASELDPGYQPKSITAPRSYDAGAASGDFIKGIQSIFGSVLGGGDIKSKIESVNKISEDLFNMKEIQKMDQKTLLRKLLAMDYLQMLTFDIDSKREGGYDFEAFLAMIAGGGVSGGENKAGDFVTSDGTLGSAKYVEKFSVDQALSGFEVGQEMVYVVARKRGDEKTPNSFAFTKKGNISQAEKHKFKTGVDAAPTSGGTADPDKLIYVNMHVLKIKVTKIESDKAFYDVLDYTTDKLIEKGSAAASGTRAVLTNSKPAQAASFVGQLKLRHSVGTQKTLTQFLDDNLAQSAEGNEEKQKQAFNLLKNYFTNLFKIDNMTRDYIATDADDKQVSKGNNILAAYDAVDQQMVDLLNIIRGDTATKATTKTGTRDKLEENKNKSLKDLDKLIEHVILNKINK